MRKLLDTACCQIQKPILLIAIGLVALLFWACQVGRSGWCNDEAAHIPAGLYHLETGRMDAYRVNPPLPRMIAAIPLLIDRPDVDWHYSESRYVRNEYQFAHQWVKGNHKNLCRHLILTRGTMVGIFVLGLWVVWKWSSRLYGRRAGWVAAVLWIIHRQLIRHGAPRARLLRVKVDHQTRAEVGNNWHRFRRQSVVPFRRPLTTSR